MSRSRKKTPISGITNSDSEKQDKRLYNRRFRRATRQAIRCSGPEIENLPHLREYANPWAMDKDGKRWFDPARYPTLMRK